MKTTVFAKKIKTKDGKTFFNFVTTLEKKDGTKQYMKVMYSGKDKNKAFESDMCPLVIEFNRDDANISTETYKSNEGEEKKRYTLWLKDYKESDEKFIDHSLDDFI